LSADLKATLRHGLSQQLRLTPELQQAIRLLTLSRLELEAELSSAIERNPLLERPEEAAPDGEHDRGAERPPERVGSDGGNGADDRGHEDAPRDGDYADFDSGGAGWGSGTQDPDNESDAWETRAAAAPSL